MNQIEDLKCRITQLERLVIGAKEFEATVTNVSDPDGLNRIKVECVNIWGIDNESPWLTSQTTTFGGDGIGDVYTPSIGDKVSVRLRDGYSDSAEWKPGFRSSRSTIPVEFSDPNINGLKTKSGTLVIYNENEGSYTVSNEAGGIIKLMADGNVEIWASHCKIHTTTELNSDSPQYGVVTAGLVTPAPFQEKHIKVPLQ
jgi:phage baseplate assembly protein gpV